MKLLTINQMRNIAEERNGECLSKFYKNSRSNLLWKCANGHKWEAVPDNIKRGTWCPYCRKTDNISEEKCRYIFEWLTGYNFPKNRLILNNGQELDGHCEEMNIAFEFNGIQHYKYIPFFHRSQTRYLDQLSRDRIKRQICESKKIKLVIVPYCSSDFLEFIQNELITLKGNIRKDLNNFSFSSFRQNISKLNKCRNFARKKKWSCLSVVFWDGQSKMMWKCSFGHEWAASWNNIRRGSGCPKCSKSNARKNLQKYTIDDMKNIAKSRNGLCLSMAYTNCKTHLIWKCSSNHTWNATPEKVMNGQWCRKCYNERRRNSYK